jgi:branched-chain amino acid transport system permease protein
VSLFLSFTVLGIVAGATFAISASGLVVTYATTGVFNFAHGAVGMVCCFTFWELAYNDTHSTTPVWLALVLVVLVEAPLLGIIIERVFMRRLHGATTARSLMVTLGMLLILLGLAEGLWSAETTRNLPAFLPNVNVRIFQVSLSGEDLLTCGVAVVVAVALWAFFRRLRIGVAMRAVVDDPELLAMAGARPVRVARMGWILGSMLAAIAGILLGQAEGTIDPTTLTLVVINSFAAAVVGKMRSLPMTFVGAVVLGLFDNYVIGYAPSSWSWLANAELAVPMIFLFLVLLLLPQDRLRAIGRPVATAVPRVVALGESLAGSAVVVVLVIIAALVVGGTLLTTISAGLVLAIAALSLVLLTGYAGQVSLCQLTFVGIGSYAMGHVAGGGSWLGVLIAVLVSAAAGALVALPTLRLRGLYLALATLAFAQGATTIFFIPEVDTKGGLFIKNLNFFGLSLQSDKGQMVLYGVIFAVASALVLAIRRGTFGRRLVGLSDSPAACATVGLDVKLTRLAVFAVSAGLAGLSGALYGDQFVTSNDFLLFTSLELLLLLVVWGVRSVSGALLAGLSLSALNLLTSNSGLAGELPFLLTGAGIVLIGWLPNGLLGLSFLSRSSPVRRVTERTSSSPPTPTPTPVGTSADVA